MFIHAFKEFSISFFTKLLLNNYFFCYLEINWRDNQNWNCSSSIFRHIEKSKFCIARNIHYRILVVIYQVSQFTYLSFYHLPPCLETLCFSYIFRKTNMLHNIFKSWHILCMFSDQIFEFLTYLNSWVFKGYIMKFG